jgi:hypothetical protein
MGIGSGYGHFAGCGSADPAYPPLTERFFIRLPKTTHKRSYIMKKKDFVTLIFATVGGILFALGMCMALLPDWNTLRQGVVTGGLGLAVLLAMVPVRRKMSGKPAIVWNARAVGITLLGVIGAVVLGVGMCLTMVWNMLVPGIAVGLAGIVLLLCLIPACKGLQ